MSATVTSDLPDYAPVPRSALGPALNEQGYYVGRVERNLYPARRRSPTSSRSCSPSGC
jgi:hypothetical protein